MRGYTRPYPACSECGHLWSDHYLEREACGFVSPGVICHCEGYVDDRA